MTRIAVPPERILEISKQFTQASEVSKRLVASLNANILSLLKPMYGELSEREWELILQAASHSLLSKGLIVSLEESEIEFVPDLLEMLIHFARSRRMLRGYSLMNDQEKVLTIHAGEEELYRFYISQERLLPAESANFRLSEARWNALTAIVSDVNVPSLLSEDASAIKYR